MASLSDAFSVETRRLILPKHERETRGLFARFLNLVLPRDPEPCLVTGFTTVLALGLDGTIKRRKLISLAVLLFAATTGIIILLSQIEILRYSVVRLLALALGTFLPYGFALGAAWVLGLVAMFSLGSFVKQDATRIELEKLPATKHRFYDIWLKFALWEEMLFRAGSEKWNWRERFWASAVFGVAHIANIWYSLAAGIALGLTGFGLMLIYQWTYRKTKDQVLATAVSGSVHAMYNVIAITVLAVAMVFALGSMLIMFLL